MNCRSVKTSTLLPPSDACLINSGSIRADLLAGDVTPQKLMAALPHGNTIAMLNVSGARVRKGACDRLETNRALSRLCHHCLVQ